MEDGQIVDLYWQRSERAIRETQAKYGRYCYAIAYRILHDSEDADESVNDTYLGAWKSMPPHRPTVLSAFLAKLTRRVSLNRWRDKHRLKRGGGEVSLALEELAECVADPRSVEGTMEGRELSESIRRFLTSLPETERDVFVCRYWHLATLGEICKAFGFGESKTKSMLSRTREKLKSHLVEEGWI